MEANNQTMPLTMIQPGEEHTLVTIVGGRGIKSKLFSMGLTPGVKLKILNKGTAGPFVVSARDFRIALGYGIARKILVR